MQCVRILNEEIRGQLEVSSILDDLVTYRIHWKERVDRMPREEFRK